MGYMCGVVDWKTESQDHIEHGDEIELKTPPPNHRYKVKIN